MLSGVIEKLLSVRTGPLAAQCESAGVMLMLAESIIAICACRRCAGVPARHQQASPACIARGAFGDGASAEPGGCSAFRSHANSSVLIHPARGQVDEAGPEIDDYLEPVP